MTGAASSRRRRPSLTLRLIAAALVWMFVLLSAGGVVLASAFRDSATQEFGERLDALLRVMIAATEIGEDGGISVKPLGDPRFDQVFSGWYWQVAGPGGQLARSRSLWDATLPVHDDAAEIRKHRVTGPRGEPLLVAERDLRLPGSLEPVHLLIAGDLHELDRRVDDFNVLLMISLAVLAAGMAGAIILQVRFGLRPLRAMTAGLAAIRDGRAMRLEGAYPREVAPVADAMNAVLDHDASMIARARTELGNLAHSLKTPLAVLRVETSGTPDTAVCQEQVRIMTRLVEHHLARAAARAGSERALGVRTMIRPVVEAIGEALTRINPDKRVTLTVEVPADAGFRGGREDLEEMLGNLMENAWRWAKGSIRVAAESSEPLVLTIEDDGPGLSETAAAVALERGARLDDATPGWGLGLSIAAEIAAIHGGRLSVGTSSLGGVKATLSFTEQS
jgi:signal transduction histidine kinase